jgi:UDP-N-acetylglucosamine 2-epimerase
MSALGKSQKKLQSYFLFIHMRRRILDSDLPIKGHKLKLLDPLGYLDFLAPQSHAALVLTDSVDYKKKLPTLGSHV